MPTVKPDYAATREAAIAAFAKSAALFVGMAALITISTIVEAADGCGQCVPQDEPGYEYLRDYGPPVVHGPQLRLDFDRRDEARYSPPNPAFKTWNNCPPNYTVQDGLCKPYTGRWADFGLR